MISGVLLAVAQPPLAVPPCAIDQAVYRLQADPRYTAGFARRDPRLANVSDLAFWLRTPKRLYWFSFGSPNGYGGTYINPGPDPKAEAEALEAERDEEPEPGAPGPEADYVSIPFDAFDADLEALQHPPQSTDPPPARLFVRGLGPALWYEPVSLAGGDETAEEESMPVSMFEPAGCGGRPDQDLD
jgi:hypothetical protein